MTGRIRMSGIGDGILDDFRALGGTASNIRLGEGRFGRGLIPTDPNLPVRIHVPENLLVVEDAHALPAELRRALRIEHRACAAASSTP